ncbi:MAG TPA: DNA replication and repair protein RecF [Rectinemataceae bacterium]|nr:DNA replication and repair protein RecF [Rectinemataceae bacterium]
MPFSSIRYAAFRNLVDAELDLAAERVFFVGENGQGKTNLLEALYYLAYGVSFRGQVDAEAVKRGAAGFSLSGRCRETLSDSSFLSEEVTVSWAERAKTIKLNGKQLRDRKELVEKNPTIVFCHEDYTFAAGEPERRRFFFDQTAGLISSSYIDVLREYKRILRQRNAALREGRSDLLELLDQQYVGRGIELMAARRRLQGEFDGRFALRFEAVSLLGREVRLRYRPSWNGEEGISELLRKLEAKRSEELALGTSLSGPHRDRWSFAAGTENFAATASTGQLRLVSLTLRLVQAEYFTEMTGRLPTLLFDDVLLELDRSKRKRFLELIPQAGQAFFTFLPGEPWEEYRTASTFVYEVSDGRFAN